MTLLPPPHDPIDQQCQIVKKRGSPRPVPEALAEKSMRAFGRFCGRLLLWVRDRAEEDIGRLQEAGVRLVETRAELATAESRLKIGEAAEKHAAAEERRAASEERRAHARKTNAEARKQEIENKLTEATALARLEDVISKIRQNGGDVRFSEEQLRLLASLSDGGGGEGPATNAE